MKKYIIGVGITLVTLSGVSAQTGVITETSVASGKVGVQNTASVALPSAMVRPTDRGTGVVKINPVAGGLLGPVLTTGDAAIDAKIKVLQKERMTKMVDLNLEYDAKIKDLVGDRKVTMTSPMGTPVAPSSANNQAIVNTSMSAQSGGDPASASMQAVVTTPPTGIRGFFYRLFHWGK